MSSDEEVSWGNPMQDTFAVISHRVRMMLRRKFSRYSYLSEEQLEEV